MAVEFELPGLVLLGQQGTGFLGGKAAVSVCVFVNFMTLNLDSS